MTWIAVDWGTTALRATRMEGDWAGDTRESENGMGGLARDGFEPALLDLVGDWLDEDGLGGGPTDIRAAGMVGARQGWAEAPYGPVPGPPMGDAVRVDTKDPRLSVRIVPGLAQRDPHPDVMRGEETQIAGILHAADGFDGCVCLPGTHTKWVHVSAGEVVSFITVMSGELFALLSERSVLRHSLTGNGRGEGWDDGAFATALSDALSRPEALAARLFRLRAADLLDDQPPATARATLSGLLLGCELAAARPWWLGRDVVVCGSDRTAPVYTTALEMQGMAPRTLSAAAMTRAGLAALPETA